MRSIAVEEKPPQWMARFRRVGGSCDREDIELWASHITAIFVSALAKGRVALCHATRTSIANVTTIPAELESTVHAERDIATVQCRCEETYWKRRFRQKSKEDTS